MITAQPEGLVVTVVVTNLDGETAFGYTEPGGGSVCVVDNAFLENDPVARTAAFSVFIAQAAIQAARADGPCERAPRQCTAGDRCANWPHNP